MTEKIQCEVVVLGGGPGGYTAAFRAADLGLKVCLVEKRARLGGVCLNAGCIPSKTLLHAAAILEEAQKADAFGIHFAEPEIDLDKLRQHKEAVIAKLTGGLDGLSKARKIRRINGAGKFLDAQTLEINQGDVNTLVQFEKAIIATGSHSFELPGLPQDERIWNSSKALALPSVPKKILIIGGGVIGMELAQVYHGLGSKITIVEMLDQIIPPADRDIIQPLFLKLKKRYSIYTKTRVEALLPTDSGVRASFSGGKAPEQEEFDAVLVAVGRKASTQGIGLESLGLAVNDRGFISVNEKQESAVPGIYAIGDVVGDPMLAHKATHQGKVAAEVIAGHDASFSAKTIPSVAYTSPEVAWIGLTEKEAKAQGIVVKKGKFPWGASGRALSADATSGVSKVLFSAESGKLVGAGICGLNAGELIHEAVLALELGADASAISKTVHAHPTLSETFAFAAEIVDGSITDMLPPKK